MTRSARAGCAPFPRVPNSMKTPDNPQPSRPSAWESVSWGSVSALGFSCRSLLRHRRARRKLEACGSRPRFPQRALGSRLGAHSDAARARSIGGGRGARGLRDSSPASAMPRATSKATTRHREEWAAQARPAPVARPTSPTAALPAEATLSVPRATTLAAAVTRP